ncbi:amidohydrolase [Aquihabitans sp. McL0605]|uniref:amidohydrolase n=1 Tax=Aquihabitans sp. McL0605 TaxID=3415671 RepID=UPI003CEC0576
MSGSEERVVAAVSALEPELIALRRDLHAHPEPSWEEHRTTARLLDVLQAAGLPARVGPTGTGVICDIGTDGPLVAIRGDIDALRMQDTKEVPYRSTVDGLCHSCGHDLHASSVVGAAIALHHELGQPGATGRVRIILQPAEESVPGGATALVAAGVVDDVHTVFALHADPSRPVGDVGVSAGAITSAADQVEIRLFGPGGHTGRPHQTADLAHIAARVVVDLPMSLGRLSDPRDGLNLTFGSIQVGDAPNVIATEARLLGSLRASGRGAWEAAPHHIARLLPAIVEPLGATWELDHQTGAPPIVNDPWAVDMIRQAAMGVLGDDHVGPTEQSAGGEDFSWYGDHARLGYFRLGVWDPARLRVDLHAGGFDLHEQAIGLGAQVLASAALRALADLASS